MPRCEECVLNILMLMIKNTAALDFALPLLWKIKQENPQANVSVLYWTLSRRKILRKSRFYSEVLSSSGISQFDFADFLQPPYVVLRELWRWLFSKSRYDSSPWEHRLRRLPFGRLLGKLIRRFLNRVERFLMSKVDYQHILPSLCPDIVLFDTTTVTASLADRDYFYNYFQRARKKVVLLPHAPHHVWTVAFTPFDAKGEQLPDYCEFWMPFRFERTWEALPERRSQFAYVGYPGLDSEWLAQIESGNLLRSTVKPRLSRSEDSLRCLFVIRKFLVKGQARMPHHTAFIYDYDEILYYLNLVGTALKQAGVDIELIVKPHPSNNFPAVKDLFAESKISNWRITHDSIYSILPEIDFVISLYSTVFFIPAMTGIPVVLLNSSTQSVVHQEGLMKKLYTGFHFYLENPEDLPVRLREVIEVVSERRRSSGAVPTGDADHLRYFYPDGAIQRCLERLEI